MSFFSQQEHLDSIRNRGEMQIKEDAPLFSRPSSPDQKLTIRLEGIPEATPGPNAFAQQAATMEKHRLDSNAFFQQAMQKRIATPPTSIHPALRARSVSDPPTPPRGSFCTTMSPFINAGEQKENSPPLQLVPFSSYSAEPTGRGRIEERREQLVYERSNSKEERTPVFVPTPKIASVDFAKPVQTREALVETENNTAKLPPKTPKRSFLEKLRITTSFRGTSSPPAPAQSSAQSTVHDETVPVKAQAVLGTSPSKFRASLGSSPSRTNVTRSPSKRKGFFRRKNSDVTDLSASKISLAPLATETEHPPPTASTVTKTPQTAFSDPTHYSYQNKRIASQTSPDNGAHNQMELSKCAIARSQSLKYFDHAIPPTPPAKNTPPDEKAKKEAALASKSSRVPFHDSKITSPNPAVGMVSTSGRLSPTKFGSYGHRETPTLITQPSMYSLHASVVPTLSEATTFEEMKARIDGLGLEGFSLPPENMRSPKAGVAYTPSIYSTDWGARPNSAFARVSPVMPHTKHHNNNSTSDQSKSTSSGGEIPICYPELAKDPSVNDIATLLRGNSTSEDRPARSRERLSAQVPWHGHTHSRDHSPSPRYSVDSTLFAQHVDDDLNEKFYDSPTSFNHPSAAPSPLQFLAATTYTPPPRKSSKRMLDDTKLHLDTHDTRSKTKDGLGISTHSRAASTSPSRRNGLFENAPSLPAQSSRGNSRSPSPQDSFHDGTFDKDINVDPLKPPPTGSPSREKLDPITDVLNQIKARNQQINSVRDEMRASNSRLDERLAAIENARTSSPSPSYTSDGNSSAGGRASRSTQNRIPTQLAHEFYRSTDGSQSSTHSDGRDSEPTGSETVAELMETNRRLLEMVGGFAQQIQALEKKVNTKPSR